jgi:hypothetical protein
MLQYLARFRLEYISKIRPFLSNLPKDIVVRWIGRRGDWMEVIFFGRHSAFSQYILVM